MSSVSKSTQFYSGFSPASIPGCQLWLDAADRTSLTLSGTNVTQWNDKSGNARNAVGNLGTGTYSSNGFNSRPTIQITPTGNMVSSVPAGTFPTAITFFVVFQKTGAENSQDVLITRTVTRFPAPFYFASYITGSNATRAIGSGTGFSSLENSNSVARLTTPTILSVSLTSSSSNWVESVNGTLSTYSITAYSEGVSNYTDNGSNIHIGTRADGGASMNGNMSEIICYSSTLTTSQRQQIEGHLAAKWGTTSTLPATHPFKRIPPFLRSFSPLDISGCALWFDAADPSTMSLTGSSMTQWRDKSGNGCNATGVNNPTYSNNTVNFVRSSSQYFTLPDGSLPSGDSAYSYFVLCKFDNDTTGCALIGGGSFGNSRQVFGFRNLGGQTTNSLLTYWWGADLVGPANQYTLNTNLIAGSFYAPGVTSGRTMFVNGTQIASDTPGARSQTTINNRIGSTNNGEFMSGTISEIVVYSSSLAPSRRQQVEGYLADKWGLRGSIPSTHPFKLSTTLSLPFSPDQLPGCALWFDGADRGVLTLSGSNVTQWNDKSGNGRNTNSVTGTPTWISNSVNKQWGVYFNGSSHFYGDFTYSSNTLSSFVVATIESDGASDGRLFSVCTTTAEDFGTALGMNVFSRIGTTTEIATFRNFSFAGRGMNISYATPFLVESILDGTSNAAFTNGNSATGGATSGNFGFTRYAIANSAGTNNAQRNKGFIFEVVMYTTVLTQSQRQQVEGYLSQKWGLKPSLPAAHPYKRSIT